VKARTDMREPIAASTTEWGMVQSPDVGGAAEHKAGVARP
jgi:hypothetical protein